MRAILPIDRVSDWATVGRLVGVRPVDYRPEIGLRRRALGLLTRLSQSNPRKSVVLGTAVLDHCLLGSTSLLGHVDADVVAVFQSVRLGFD